MKIFPKSNCVQSYSGWYTGNFCSYKEEKPDYWMKKSVSRRCHEDSVNCDNSDFPFLQCRKQRCETEYTWVPQTYTKYTQKSECCPGWSDGKKGWFFRQNKCTEHTSCITLPQYTPKPCAIKRESNLVKNRHVFRLTTPPEHVPETISEEDVTEANLLDFATFPVLNITAEEVVALTLSIPSDRNWAIAYPTMGKRIRKIINETLEPKNFRFFTKFSDYADLLDFYRKRQITGVPFDKYFRYPSQELDFKDIIKEDLWQEDKVFAEQRVGGLNNMILRKLKLAEYESKKSNLNGDLEEAVKRSMGGTLTMSEMIEKGLLYIVDYPLMRGLSNVADVLDLNPTDKREMRKSRSPLAFFGSVQHCSTKQYELKPLAIQTDLDASAPVFTPSDGAKWLLAKEEVQLADLAHVEMIEHLLKTHFLMEAVCVTAKRTLSDYHPLYEVLKWHCRCTFMTNRLGLPALIKPHGLMNRLFAIGHVGAIELLNKGYREYSWKYSDFEELLKERDVLDTEKLPYFPYRDDGMVIWRLIRGFANEYIDLYYKNNAFVKGDTELQNFANELSAEGLGPNGGLGMVKGFPTGIETKQQLKDIFTRIVFTPIQHHTVNYPVAYYGGFVPNMPSKLYDDPRSPPDEFSIYNLPQSHIATVQVATFMIIASIRYDDLFDYAPEMADKNGGNIVQKYYDILMGPTLKLLQERNKQRLQDGHLTYPYFLPGWMPNSIQS